MDKEIPYQKQLAKAEAALDKVGSESQKKSARGGILRKRVGAGYGHPTHRGASTQVGRNMRCTCGSGKKYKKCCLNKGKGISDKVAFQAKVIDTIPYHEGSAPVSSAAFAQSGGTINLHHLAAHHDSEEQQIKKEMAVDVLRRLLAGPAVDPKQYVKLTAETESDPESESEPEMSIRVLRAAGDPISTKGVETGRSDCSQPNESNPPKSEKSGPLAIMEAIGKVADSVVTGARRK